jgi:hypothetical protein
VKEDERKRTTEKEAKMILEFCRRMLRELDQTTDDDIVNDFRDFVRNHRLG